MRWDVKSLEIKVWIEFVRHSKSFRFHQFIGFAERVRGLMVAVISRYFQRMLVRLSPGSMSENFWQYWNVSCWPCCCSYMSRGHWCASNSWSKRLHLMRNQHERLAKALAPSNERLKTAIVYLRTDLAFFTKSKFASERLPFPAQDSISLSWFVSNIFSWAGQGKNHELRVVF